MVHQSDVETLRHWALGGHGLAPGTLEAPRCSYPQGKKLVALLASRLLRQSGSSLTIEAAHQDGAFQMLMFMVNTGRSSSSNLKKLTLVTAWQR